MIKFYIQTNNSKNYLRCWFNFDGHSITTLRSNLNMCNEFDHSLTSSKALPSSDNDGQYQLHTFLCTPKFTHAKLDVHYALITNSSRHGLYFEEKNLIYVFHLTVLYCFIETSLN